MDENINAQGVVSEGLKFVWKTNTNWLRKLTNILKIVTKVYLARRNVLIHVLRCDHILKKILEMIS